MKLNEQIYRIGQVLILLLLFVNIKNAKTQNYQAIVDSVLISVKEMPEEEQVGYLLSQCKKYRYNSALNLVLLEANNLAEKYGEEQTILNVIYHRGNYFYFNGQLDSAKIYLNKALTKADASRHPFMYPAILNTLGGVYGRLGDMQQSISYLMNAKKYFLLIDTTSLSPKDKERKVGQLAIVSNTLAVSNKKIKNYEEALAYYDESYNYFRDIGATSFAGTILSNKGDLLNTIERYADATDVLEQALELKIEGKATSSSIAITELNLGTAKMQQGDLTEAMHLIKRSVSVFEKEQDKSGAMSAEIELGKCYYKLKNAAQAVEHCSNGKQLAKEIEDIESEIMACECLNQAFEMKGDYKAALSEFKLMTELNDSIFNKENVKKMTEMELNFEFEKERELNALKEQTRAKQARYAILSLIGTLAFLMVVAFLLWRRFVTSRKNAAVLKGKNDQIAIALKEKESLIEEIHHRVKNNLQVISSLLSLQSRSIKNEKAKQALEDGQNRVHSMALIHKDLYQEGNIIGVDLPDYINKLANNLIENYNYDKTKIQLNTKIDDVKLDVDKVIPLGLIINELISNTLKYAFKGKENGIIDIELNQSNERLALTIKDDGIGLPENFNHKKDGNLGLDLVNSFAKRLKAKLEVFTGNGTTFKFDIPI